MSEPQPGEYDLITNFASSFLSKCDKEIIFGSKESHREKDGKNNARFGVFRCEADLMEAISLVARPLKPAEWKNIKEARAAVQAELEKLIKKGAWNPDEVREWADVVAES